MQTFGYARQHRHVRTHSLNNITSETNIAENNAHEYRLREILLTPIASCTNEHISHSHNDMAVLINTGLKQIVLVNRWPTLVVPTPQTRRYR